MTVVKTFNLQCDNEDCEMPMFDLNSTPDWQSGAEVRAVARRAGWRRTRDGRDFCPDHANTAARSLGGAEEATTDE